MNRIHSISSGIYVGRGKLFHLVTMYQVDLHYVGEMLPTYQVLLQTKLHSNPISRILNKSHRIHPLKYHQAFLT